MVTITSPRIWNPNSYTKNGCFKILFLWLEHFEFSLFECMFIIESASSESNADFTHLRLHIRNFVCSSKSAMLKRISSCFCVRFDDSRIRDYVNGKGQTERGGEERNVLKFYWTTRHAIMLILAVWCSRSYVAGRWSLWWHESEIGI